MLGLKTVKKFYTTRNKILIRAAVPAQEAASIAMQEAAVRLGWVANNTTLAVTEAATSRLDFIGRSAAVTGSGGLVAKNIFDGVQDFVRGDVVCTGACCIACLSEVTSAVCCILPVQLRGPIFLGTKFVTSTCMVFRYTCANSKNPIPGC